MQNLYNTIQTSIDHLQAKEAKEGLTDLEKDIDKAVWDLLRLVSRHPSVVTIEHPEGWAPNADAQPLSDFDKEEAAKRERAATREALSVFLKKHKISQRRFGQVYGCSETYVSRMLSNGPNAVPINAVSMAAALSRLGFSCRFDFTESKWEIV